MVAWAVGSLVAAMAVGTSAADTLAAGQVEIAVGAQIALAGRMQGIAVAAIWLLLPELTTKNVVGYIT